MEAFNRGVAAPNWELRRCGAKELPKSVCTCRISAVFPATQTLLALSQKLLWPGHMKADRYLHPCASSEPWEVKHLPPTQHRTQPGEGVFHPSEVL